ncbi:hypothetical protein [Dehalobacterium formicoaceticum]|uniref:Uncharacterized protein n=1 Tax=Dehalobacterium formicoaceticum TaxID=51515 RepID=A0ABT1Y877_9FIRM|nr:hypothetical protein [Dehalobacterium formicoaceticum]MCR6546691.1 hypothetical protein [Dehalobacterium formicoaceticum]
MFELNSYFFILLNITSGLLSLLGAVGIFISLIIQRRVSRLQDIIEEILDLSYEESANTTVKIQNLIYKYQMQYIFPAKPIKTVIHYININIAFQLLFWSWLLYLIFRGPFNWVSLIYLWPLFAMLFVMLFYRKLIKCTLNPVDNRLFNSFIPPPRYLRSIAFLSSYVNVAVKTIMQQARPTPVLRQKSPDSWEVLLKEELPLDDYHYYFVLKDRSGILFDAYGHVLIELDQDPITGKPRPTARNLNIPLGIIEKKLQLVQPQAYFFVFPKGEKNPITFTYLLEKIDTVYFVPTTPEVSTNHFITYHFCGENTLQILTNEATDDIAKFLPEKIPAHGMRRYQEQGGQEQVIESKPYID